MIKTDQNLYTHLPNSQDPINKLLSLAGKNTDRMKCILDNSHGNIDLPVIENENSFLGVIEFLMSQGADIHANDDYALRLACEYGHLSVVKFLLSTFYNGAYADVHANNDEPLELACEKGHLGVVEYLINEGANLHTNGDNAIRIASGEGHTDIFNFLIKKGSIEHQQAFLCASENGHIDVVKLLVKNFHDEISIDDYNDALIAACENNQVIVAKFLLDQGASVYAISKNSIAFMRYKGFVNILKFLEEIKVFCG